MAELRPRGMSQGELAELLRENGFTACSKAAVSLAERSKLSGVQFTPEARKAARSALKSTRRQENRKNGNKTTVWLDDELRAWVEKEAYLKDTNVGGLIRNILHKEMVITEAARRMADAYARIAEREEKAASDVGASEAAGEKSAEQR